MNSVSYKKGSIFHFVIRVLFFFFMTRSIAYAYIDPGSGAYILQMLIACLIGVLFSLTRFWTRVKILFFQKNTHPERKSAGVKILFFQKNTHPERKSGG